MSVELLNRDFIATEKVKDYYETANQRISCAARRTEEALSLLP